MKALDIAFMLRNQKELIQAILNRIESKIKEVLKGKITMKIKAKRLELVKQYNKPKFHDNTFTLDSTLIQIQKSQNKQKQRKNQLHKQIAERNYQIRCLQDE